MLKKSEILILIWRANIGRILRGYFRNYVDYVQPVTYSKIVKIISGNWMAGTGVQSGNLGETVSRMHRSNNSFSTRIESGHGEW